jgi:hypothetical protein
MTRAIPLDTGLIKSNAHGKGRLDMTNIDFEQSYNEAIDEMLRTAPNDPEQILTLPELQSAITTAFAEASADDALVKFDDFDGFFKWWDTLTAYEQMDEDFNAEDHKPILKVAYDSLKASGKL